MCLSPSQAAGAGWARLTFDWRQQTRTSWRGLCEPPGRFDWRKTPALRRDLRKDVSGEGKGNEHIVGREEAGPSLISTATLPQAPLLWSYLCTCGTGCSQWRRQANLSHRRARHEKYEAPGRQSAIVVGNQRSGCVRHFARLEMRRVLPGIVEGRFSVYGRAAPPLPELRRSRSFALSAQGRYRPYAAGQETQRSFSRGGSFQQVSWPLRTPGCVN